METSPKARGRVTDYALPVELAALHRMVVGLELPSLGCDLGTLSGRAVAAHAVASPAFGASSMLSSQRSQFSQHSGLAAG